MASLTDKVDDLFSAWNNPDSPGCVIAITRDGKLVYGRGYGMANLEHGVPLSTNSVFEIASTSKQFVAMSVALLVRQGKLGLDDEIQKYLPEIRRYENTITLRHLIHHTSGLSDHLYVGFWAGFNFENHYPVDEVIGLISRQKVLNFQPGEEHQYSNTGYVLLAEIIKRVSGLNLRAFAEQNIFAPLGMKNTHFHDDYTEIVPNRASAYSPRESGGYKLDMTNLDVVGDGGLYTTVEDLCLWDANFYNNILGGYGQDLIEEVTTSGQLNSGEVLGYAHGLFVESYRRLKVVSHSGGWFGYGAELMRFPEQGFSVICLTNLGNVDPAGLAKRIADIYLAEQFTAAMDEKSPQAEQPVLELPVAELEAKIGFYRGGKTGRLWELTMQADKLTVESQWGGNFQIFPTQPNRFVTAGPNPDVIAEFEQHAGQGPDMMRVQIDGQKPDVLTRIEVIAVPIDQLKVYAGNYHSDELDITYQLLVENDRIVFRLKGFPKEIFRPINPTAFVCRGFGLFEFVFNKQDHVTGFCLGADRVRRIQFVKTSGTSIEVTPVV
jgi:CubicO group peptidase (beta-lactamase class C family)